MFKPKSPAKAAEDSATNKLRLPTESALRSLAGLKELMNQAKQQNGSTVELPWTNSTSSQRFILGVVWNQTSMNPTWTLSEENDAGSNVLWTQPWAPSDLELMYDVLAMSTGSISGTATQMPEMLKPDQNGAASDQFIGGKEKASAPNGGGLSSVFPKHAGGQPPAETPGVKVGSLQAHLRPTTPPQAPLTPEAPAKDMPPDKPAQPAPLSTMSVIPTESVSPSSPASESYTSQIQPSSALPSVPENYASSKSSPSAAPASSAPNPAMLQTDDSALLKKKSPDIRLGRLLTEAQLITKPTLEAALKVQELVQANKISAARAPEILKLLSSMGAAIESYIDSADLLVSEGVPSRADLVNEQASCSVEQVHLALDLLDKAGLLLQDDLRTANQALSRHGGTLLDVLQSNHKLDANTAQAAVICAGLVQAGTMKIEQCVIALNYCNRSRVGFDEALAELNWENPRQPSKDL